MTREERLVECIKNFERVIEKLDEAMASQERIDLDTVAVGGFVSTLNIVETEECIVDRAIAIIKAHKKCPPVT